MGKIFINNSAMAVSYTHLDVYKRQGGSNLETPQEQINEWIQSVKNLL